MPAHHNPPNQVIFYIMSIAEFNNYKNASDNSDLKHIPGSYGRPFIGHYFDMVNDLYGTIDRQYCRYGPVSKLSVAYLKGVLLVGPDIYGEVYLDKNKNFSAEMGYSRTLGRFYKGALLLRDHNEHRLQRRIMQSAFKTEAMRGYFSTMGPMIQDAVESWDGRKDLLFFPAIKRTLLDVAARIFVGLDKNDERANNLNRAFLDIATGLMGFVAKEIPGTKYARGKKAQRYLQDFFGSLIEERRYGDGIDTFSYFTREKTENGGYFSDDDIIAHMSFLLFAAHDTTTSALSHLMLHLGENPEWQQRLRDEAMSIDKDFLDYDDLDKMPYTDAAIKETLRLHPSAMVAQRRTIRDCELGGHFIPANTILFLVPQYNHRMAEYWDNPHSFEPDRWLDPRNEHKRHPFNFVGFGGGAHKCIGMHFALMQSKTFVHQFLPRYKFTLTADSGKRLQTVPLPKPADDLPIKLKRIR